MNPEEGERTVAKGQDGQKKVFGQRLDVLLDITGMPRQRLAEVLEISVGYSYQITPDGKHLPPAPKLLNLVKELIQWEPLKDTSKEKVLMWLLGEDDELPVVLTTPPSPSG